MGKPVKKVSQVQSKTQERQGDKQKEPITMFNTGDKNDKSTENTNDSSKKSYIWQYVFEGKSAMWTAIFTALLVVFTYLLYQVSDRMEEMQRVVQRAFITFQELRPGIRFIDPATGKMTAIQISVVWVNNGATPTRMFTWHNMKASPAPLPRNFTFVDSTNPDERIASVVGPKGTALSVPFIVLVDSLDNVRLGKGHLYFWGAAKYHNVFRDTPEHVTEFCVEVTNVIELNSPEPGMGAQVTPCPTHNCYDDDCKKNN